MAWTAFSVASDGKPEVIVPYNHKGAPDMGTYGWVGVEASPDPEEEKEPEDESGGAAGGDG